MRAKGKTNLLYSWTTLVLLFFLFAFVGWIWEGIFVGWNYGVFLNRGFLHGPWLPIYGVGSVLIITLLARFRKKPLLAFAGSVAICGIAEYTTSWALEAIFHQRWWDYSHCFMNLQGRVCLQSLIPFGIAGVFLVCFAAPFLSKQIKKIPLAVQYILCGLLGLIFLADVIISVWHPNAGMGITY